MTKSQLIDLLKQKCYNSANKLNSATLTPSSKIYQKEIHESLLSFTLNFTNARLQERIYVVKNNLDERPKCYCGTPLKYKNESIGYATYCSTMCQHQSPEKNKKIKEHWANKTPEEIAEHVDKNKRTKEERYGSRNYNNSEKISKTWLAKPEDEIQKRNLQIKKTKLEKYGDENYCNGEKISEVQRNFSDEKREEIKQKRIETSLEKYGVEYPLQSDIVRDKMKETLLERYGIEHPMHSQIFIDKVMQTKAENGTLHNSPDVIMKSKSTNIERYGAITFTASPEGKSQVFKTKEDRYGDGRYCNKELVSFVLKSKSKDEWSEIHEKRYASNLERFGTKTYAESDESKIAHFTKHYNIYVSRYKDENISILTSYDEYISNRLIKSRDKVVKMQCDVCGLEWDDIMSYNGTLCFCLKCNPYTNKTDFNIFNNLLNIGEFEYRTRSVIYPFELDLYVKDKNFAIEYDGLMYHSFGKSKHSKFNSYLSEADSYLYHLTKTQLCEEKGIQLFHIFESEWIDKTKKAIWTSMIKSKLKTLNRIFARKCDIREISSNESKDFLDENHMQGNVNASVRIGLFFNNELVSVMTFGKSRYDKSIEYELLRYSVKLNLTVVGGASKLLSYFEKVYKPKSLVSYANRRWSQGNVYEKLNFKLQEITAPNYFYFKNNILESRIKYQKHKLKDILETFDENLSESENMYNNGYRKIYDCGNLKFVKEYDGK